MLTKTLILVLFTSLLINLVLSNQLSQRHIIYAINTGSQQEVRSSTGVTYQKDQFFDPSDNSIAVDYRGDNEIGAEIIKYTYDEQLYKTERHAYQSFKYLLPIEKMQSTNYVLILKFCESYFKSKNKRQFNIKIGNKVVRKNFDVFEKAGGRLVAYDEYIELEYSNNQIKVNGQVAENAIVNNKLVIVFEKTSMDNPIINGIILYEGLLIDTDYYDLPKFKIEWENRQKAEEQKANQGNRKKISSKFYKKHKKVKIRNDHLENMEEDMEDIQQDNSNNVQKQEQTRQIPPLRELLMTPLGIVAIIGCCAVTYVLVAHVILGLHENQKKIVYDSQKNSYYEVVSNKYKQL